MGGKKVKNPLRQIEVIDNQSPDGNKITLTDKTEIEQAIMARETKEVHVKHSTHPFPPSQSSMKQLTRAIQRIKRNPSSMEIFCKIFLVTFPYHMLNFNGYPTYNKE